MALWKGIIDRSKNDGIRKEDDRTTQLEHFFDGRSGVISCEIIDHKDWLVNIDGSLHIYKNDLNEDGTLPFKIGELTGDLYCHVRELNPTIIPAKMGGSIVFVVDEVTPGIGTNNQADDEDDDKLDMGLLQAKKPQESKIKQKIADVLSDYIEYGYTFDIQELIEEIKAEKNIDYKLTMTAEKAPRGFDVKLFVREGGSPLNLTAIEKAIYMTFILHENGLGLLDMKTSTYQITKKIYSQLSDRVEDDENGLMGNVTLTDLTLNGHRSEIRSAIKEQIQNKHIIDQFAIEGYKDEPFRVAKGTPELREQIKKTFGI
jgi:hypothetical protein